MDKEKHLALVQKIRANLNNEGEVSLLLTEMADDYGKVMTDLQQKEAEAQRLKEANDRLKEQNMNLFLKIGGNPEVPPAPPTPPEPKRLSFDELIDEKGRLKK